MFINIFDQFSSTIPTFSDIYMRSEKHMISQLFGFTKRQWPAIEKSMFKHLQFSNKENPIMSKHNGGFLLVSFF
jgi:hypothetical protein